MANRIKLNNGDFFRVVQGKGLFSETYMIQAREASKGKTNWYTIGRKDSLSEAIEEMNRRAKVANIKGFC